MSAPIEYVAAVISDHFPPVANVERGNWDCPCGVSVARSANGWERHLIEVLNDSSLAIVIRLGATPDYGTWFTSDCLACDSKRRELLAEAGDAVQSLSSRMIVCPVCGDKRCAKALSHRNDCNKK